MFVERIGRDRGASMIEYVMLLAVMVMTGFAGAAFVGRANSQNLGDSADSIAKVLNDPSA